MCCVVSPLLKQYVGKCEGTQCCSSFCVQLRTWSWNVGPWARMQLYIVVPKSMNTRTRGTQKFTFGDAALSKTANKRLSGAGWPSHVTNEAMSWDRRVSRGWRTAAAHSCSSQLGSIWHVTWTGSTLCMLFAWICPQTYIRCIQVTSKCHGPHFTATIFLQSNCSWDHKLNWNVVTL